MLSSYSVIHRAPLEGMEIPFILAAVDLEEGWSMFSNLIGEEPDKVKIGMSLKVAFVELPSGRALPFFTRAGRSSAA